METNPDVHGGTSRIFIQRSTAALGFLLPFEGPRCGDFAAMILRLGGVRALCWIKALAEGQDLDPAQYSEPTKVPESSQQNPPHPGPSKGPLKPRAALCWIKNLARI